MSQPFRRLADFFRTEYRDFLLMSTVSFLSIVVLSYIVGRLFPDLCLSIVEYLSTMIADSGVVDESGTIHLLPLLTGNLWAMVLCVAYGFIPFLHLPALSLGVNSILLGTLAAYYSNNGISLVTYLAGILPHGIFELPALFLSLGCGLLLCRRITTYVRKNEKGVLRPLLQNEALVLLFLVLPLLVLAAVMETYVTPSVMAYFM